MDADLKPGVMRERSGLLVPGCAATTPWPIPLFLPRSNRAVLSVKV